MSASFGRAQRLAASALLLFATGCVTARAVNPGAIVSDRPDFTESAVVVPAGATQVEIGTTLTREADAWGTSAGELLLRSSLHPRAELRVTASYEGVSGPVRSGGLTDPSLGAKFALRDGGDAGTSVAVIVGSTIPVGAGPSHASSAQPEIKLGVARPLSDRLAVATNLNYAWERDEIEGRHAYGASVSLGLGLTEHWGSYAEAYHLGASGVGVEGATYVNAGLTRAIGHALQIDARIGGNTTAMRRNYFVGLGLVRRW